MKGVLDPLRYPIIIWESDYHQDTWRLTGRRPQGMEVIECSEGANDKSIPRRKEKQMVHFVHTSNQQR